MISRLARTLGARSLGTGVLLSVLTLTGPAAFGGDLIVKGNIPFAFKVAGKTLPAGEYEFQFASQREAVTVSSTSLKGPGAVAVIVTYLAPPAHSSTTDAHLVFDKSGNDYILSEIWRPNADGILVHITKGSHEHRVHHMKY